MAKQLIFHQEARHRLQAGIGEAARAIALTPGPKGGNVAIDQKRGAPVVTHDGATVAIKKIGSLLMAAW